MRSYRSAEALLVFSVALWGFNYTAQRYGLTHGFSPLVFASLRLILAAVGCLLLVRLAGGRYSLTRRDLVIVSVTGVVGQGLLQVALSYANRFVGASTIAIVFGLLPVCMAVVATVLRIERLALRHWLGVAVSAGGVTLIAVAGGGQISDDLKGIGLALLGVLFFSFYAVILFVFGRRYAPTVLNAVSVGAAALFVTAIAGGQFASQSWSTPGVLSWTAIAYAGFVSLTIGNAIFFYAQKRVGPGRIGALQRFVDHVLAHDRVWVARGGDIARHWRENFPPGALSG